MKSKLINWLPKKLYINAIKFIKFEEQIKQMPYTSIKLINVHKVFKILKTFWHGVPIAHTVII